MYELSLYGQVLDSQYLQLVHILSGISFMQPKDIVIHHTLYLPPKPKTAAGRQIGGSQNIEVTKSHQSNPTDEHYYVDLQRRVSGPDEAGWVARTDHLPEATARKVVTGRNVVVDPIKGNAPKYVEAKSLKFATEYLLGGSTWVHGDVVFVLYRLFPVSDQPDKGPVKELPSISELTPLDPSGSWILRTYVMIGDNNKPEPLRKGTDQLLRVQTLLKGVVDLEPGDRLALDTRVK